MKVPFVLRSNVMPRRLHRNHREHHSTPGRRRSAERRRARGEGEEIDELDEIRAPLLLELSALLRDPDYHRGEPPHLCCRRARNQMRISPLEAEAIARAFRRDPALRAKLPSVLERLRRELPRLRETTARQGFDCPLLEGTRCLVHELAKPIGCTAWNPGLDFTEVGWEAFACRDQLNDRVHGPRWKLQVIPLWLKRVFRRELRSETAEEDPARKEAEPQG